MRFSRGPARPGRPARSAAIDWLIVGLGNPGREHDRTRHNVGFAVLDELARRWDAGAPKQRFKGRLIEELRVPRQAAGRDVEGLQVPRQASGPAVRVALLWPMTYMNESGRSVGPARGSYKLGLDRLIVVHDEIDVPFGEVRTRRGGGLAGHNGLKSLRRELGDADFWRVRVGVGRPPSSDPDVVSDYVLSRFREGADDVAELIDGAASAVEQLVEQERG